ncbi:50S ribosomal protein L1 [Haladaptatus sp. F3-133]|uniref:Large ribosomal subunit protein uL1 n=1 Tax=Halorutilus salinus TaxID=2487751 RepID=A0A9Q4C503_9EURY|nr:50S ribosomal protein L1 [Halorutilus salinus]MCX2819296.1 50S ribosomal protein L1 [Halorutilus salinus]
MDTDEAVEKALSEREERNFNETVDLAINLRDLDLSQPDNRVDMELVLPEGTGQDTRVAVIADGETAVRAEDVADRVIRPDELEDLADDENEAKDLADEMSFFIAETDYMQDIGRYLGTILGPRGKMPSPVEPDDDVVEEVQRLKGTVALRSGDRRTFHTTVGTEEMATEELADNIEAVLRRLTADLEKGELNLDSVYVKTTMGPAMEVA